MNSVLCPKCGCSYFHLPPLYECEKATAMKTAEEVAEEIYWKISKSTNELDWKQLFSQALTAYAEERLKEAQESGDLGMYSVNDVKAFQIKARAEALEEAALLVDSEIVWTPDHICLLIQKIRALKDKP